MPNRLIHDESFLLARELVGSIRHLLREEEVADAFQEFYQLAMKAMQHYAEAEERRRKRLRPEGGGT